MNSVKRKKGFTFVEMLTTIAILTITFSIVGLSAGSIKKNIEQTKADTIARDIYIVAQDNLTKLMTSGNMDGLNPGDDGVTKLTQAPSDYVLNDGDTLDICRVGKKNNDISKGANKLVPEDSVDEEYRNGEWIIEYDPTTGIVISVYFADKNNIDNEFYNDQYRDNLRESRDNRLDYYDNKKYHIGYYGGNESTKDKNKNNNKDHCSVTINVYNTDTLEVEYKVFAPSNHVDDTVELKLTYTGEMSDATVTKTVSLRKSLNAGSSLGDNLTFVKGDGSSTNPYIITEVLDTLEAKKHFADYFPTFYAGENIKITAIAHCPNVQPANTSSSPIFKRLNSLYASYEKGSDYEGVAEIGYGRHLQNLNYNDDSIKIQQAVQIRDIDFSGDYLRSVGYKAIYNDDLVSYQGNGYSITSVDVTSADVNGNGGVFGTFGFSGTVRSEIVDLTLIDTVISASVKNGGALIGQAKDNVIINNCQVRLSETYCDIVEGPSSLIKANNAAGGLVGYAGKKLTIENSFAATVVEGKEIVGGLVGEGDEGATISVSYADCYLNGKMVGGLAGSLKNASISNVYTAGATYNCYPAHCFGITSTTVSSIKNVYTIFDTSSGTIKCSTVPLCTGTVSNVAHVDSMISTIGDIVGVKEYSAEDLANKDMLQTILGTGKFEISTQDSHPYNYYGTDLGNYPYPRITGMAHYGDWVGGDDADDVLGFLYWELEAGGSDPGYHFYIINNKESVIFNNLCTGYDCGGIVQEYGYGYIIRTDKVAGSKVDWDEASILTTKDASGKNDVPVAPRITAAEAALRSQFSNAYTATLYRTIDSSIDACQNKTYKWTTLTADMILGDYSNLGTYNRDGLYLIGYHTYTTVDIKAGGSTKTYSFDFNPFFACDISVETTKLTLLNYLDRKILNRKHQIRSIQQLQFLNWNCLECNCQTKVRWDDSMYEPFAFPYLWKMITAGSNLYNFSIQSYNQTHDIDAKNYSNYCPIAAIGTTSITDKFSTLIGSSSAFNAYAWFAGEYDGGGHIIKNLDITSDSYTVGVFGTAIGARFSNVIMTSDTKSTIKKLAGNADKTSDYFVGGLVGYCGIASLDIGNLIESIENCAIGNYQIIDESAHNCTYVGSAIGGLVGASQLRILNCSAVVDIYNNATSTTGSVIVGGLVGCESGGILSASLPAVYNCYTGGSINFNSNTKSYTANMRGYYVAGVVGSNRNISVANVTKLGGFEYSITAVKCYTYMDLPIASDKDNIYSIGVIMATSCTPLYQKLYSGGLATNSYLANCYYYNRAITGSVTNNFIEVESFVDTSILDPLGKIKGYYVNTNISSSDPVGSAVRALWDTQNTTLSTGAKALTYNEMVLEGGSKIATHTYYNGHYVYSGQAGNDFYPFGAVVKRNGQSVHVGYWPKATKISLNGGIYSGDKITAYIAKDENVSKVESYIASKIPTNKNCFNFGYQTTDGTYFVKRVDESKSVGVNNVAFASGYCSGSGNNRTWNSTASMINAGAKYGYLINLYSPYYKDENGVSKSKVTLEYIKTSVNDMPSKLALAGTIARTPGAEKSSKIDFIGWYEIHTEKDSKGNNVAVRTQNTDGNGNVIKLSTDSTGVCNLYAGWELTYDKIFINVPDTVGFTSQYDEYLIASATGGKYYLLQPGTIQNQGKKTEHYTVSSVAVTIKDYGLGYVTLIDNNYKTMKYSSDSKGQYLYFNNYGYISWALFKPLIISNNHNKYDGIKFNKGNTLSLYSTTEYLSLSDKGVFSQALNNNTKVYVLAAMYNQKVQQFDYK